MVILREKKEPDLHQALIIFRLSYTSSRQLFAGGALVDVYFSALNSCTNIYFGLISQASVHFRRLHL